MLKRINLSIEFEISFFFLFFLKARETIIERHTQAVQKTSILKSLLSEAEEYEPFDLIEIAYEPVNQYVY